MCAGLRRIVQTVGRPQRAAPRRVGILRALSSRAMSLIDFCSCTNSVEDVAHHFRFVQEHAVAGGLAVALPDIRETVGRTAQGADLTVARTMDLAASRPLQDLRALVLRDHALHLHEQLVLRRLARRAVEEDRRDPLLAQLVEQQHLVGVLARQAVGVVHVQPVDASLGDPIAQPLESAGRTNVEPLKPSTR